jgi:two-component system response regulator WspF
MRIAIVNDVRLAVEALRRVVTQIPNYEIPWVAHDGEEAVTKCAADVPDVILMDLVMPRLNGAEATQRIMRESPCAILIVTATVEGNAGMVFNAMGFGALDVVETPTLGPNGNIDGAAKLLAKIATIGKLIGKPEPRVQTRRTARTDSSRSTENPLVAIGASTGGPKALADILTELPHELPAAVVIVQHVDIQFAANLAKWLATETGHDVQIAREGERPVAGGIYLATTNDHLMLTDMSSFKYRSEPAEYPYRPSVDVFFKSAVKNWTGSLLGVLLTGMGSDGAEGLLAIRQAGWHTIAQDRNSSVVYGMPKAAAERGAAAEILPIGRIAAAITKRVQATQKQN